MKSVTLPHAYREIERLKQKVQDLEGELKYERKAQPVQQLSTPPSLGPSTPVDHDPGNNELDVEGGQGKWISEGIHISTARSPQKTWYGSSSIFYFIGRINTFLTSAFHQSYSANRLLPNSASYLLDGPTTGSGDVQSGRTTPSPNDHIKSGDYLTPPQEQFFLDIFWESYHTSCPILDELEFKEHQRSLWATSDKERKPSALVDIVIAVCMQYGMARLPDAGRGSDAASRADVNQNDATIAGRWHYQRCQKLLSNELESPTISTLQCHILCSIYLCCGSFQNMADNACCLAVRTAFMLGLHLEPPATISRRERELRKRLWWTLYVLESKMGMKLGRPFLLHDTTMTCTLPADDREIAVLSGSSFVPLGQNVTWLTWNLHNTKLMLAARTAYTAFYDKTYSAFNYSNGQPVTDRLDQWLRGVPDALKTKRQNNGIPFSTDLSAPEIEQFAPHWLQRQRLLLELMYHNLCTNLYRPAISFPPVATPTLLPEKTAIKCAAHAMALTHMMHQVLSSTSILAGWHEAIQWQWNAAMTLVGFVLMYPRSESTPAARTAIDLSVAVLEVFGNSVAVAASGANIMSDLGTKVDLLYEQNQGMRGTSQNLDSAPENMPMDLGGGQAADDSFTNGSFDMMQLDGFLNFDDDTAAEITGVLAQSIDLFAGETYNNYDWLGVNSNFPGRDFNKPILVQQ